MRQYAKLLKQIDERIAVTKPEDIPALFRDIPLDVFGQLSLQEQTTYNNIKAFFPRMASEKIQDRWTGRHGKDLLCQTVGFVDCMIDFYRRRTGVEELSGLQVLDFGCGWGRMIRLLYKYVPESSIYAADAWEQSLQTCRDYGVRANFGKVENICTGIPFDVKFDIIFAFSVFTHLSSDSAGAAMRAFAQKLKQDGVLVITIRNTDFWRMRGKQDKDFPAERLIDQHIREGYTFHPRKRENAQSDNTFGLTSISVEYMQEHWTDWKIIDYKLNSDDPYQCVVFLKPAQ